MKIGKFIKTVIFTPRIIPFSIPKREIKPEEQPIPVQIPARRESVPANIPDKR